MDLIVGAGISGIAYATFTDNDYLMIDKDQEIGGYCKTIKRNGYVWDYSGHFFHFRDEKLKELVCRHIASETLKTVKKVTKIYYKGKYIDFPFQKNIHQLEKHEFIECLYDLFNTESIQVKTFKDMVYANLGKSISDKFLIPYNEKLYACDLNNLDAEAMGRFFPKANKEEIILNFKKENNSSYNDNFVYSSQGAIEYVNSLFRNVKQENVFLQEELQRIDIVNKVAYTNKREISYDRLISTMPFPKLLKLCDIGYDESIFTWNKVMVFNLGFDKKGKDKESSWVYVPDKDICFYRLGYYDNIIKSDRMSLYVELGFTKDAVIGDTEKVLERVLSDLKKIGVVTDEQLVDNHSVVMDPAYVHINQKSVQIVEHFKQQLANHDIYSIGRYGSWTYCSIEDNIIEARELALENSLKIGE
ncbi:MULTISPECIES: protoporphyrinogen/coproporphyrinogen oxidase [Capnocytophaga]|uniref:protoporphyrinogen/coproporphyrinogen oxidase n=1 Tax=Capnocytophaga TaxID=1016 RepID=UPI000BB1A7AF|nr:MULTISPECIES: NAD(P)-binding protein [Capnocytophaga]ATA74631.1 LPS biosynthesis protein [Capnocytophaga sp. H2931]